MERHYLLTYRMKIDENHQYDWFETEEQLKEFIKTVKPYWVFDAFKINNAERLDLEKD
jgi:hypothetical protein